jgi:hypothetical protein
MHHHAAQKVYCKRQSSSLIRIANGSTENHCTEMLRAIEKYWDASSDFLPPTKTIWMDNVPETQLASQCNSKNLRGKNKPVEVKVHNLHVFRDLNFHSRLWLGLKFSIAKRIKDNDNQRITIKRTN